jgi:transcriptional regulator with XRE-family HTH domain
MANTQRGDLLQSFGAVVRALRRSQGLSQEEFADTVGLHRTYVGDVERGERNVGLINVGRIADALNVSPSALLAEAEKHQTNRR